ncbi:hypothetical protein M011DRAFT_269662 [Sporormia fimetaria CBS 119925]|uniref:Uncharacterized protein n=1 Tax=Sporormia fimetaria CBS 119925 TaxID=1340428 RepID=A0A6A6UXH3_9PLEO|nr:hypothetical protein M011DRAFT_269662 [Sporormia fimetaria CBS 119925]
MGRPAGRYSRALAAILRLMTPMRPRATEPNTRCSRLRRLCRITLRSQGCSQGFLPPNIASGLALCMASKRFQSHGARNRVRGVCDVMVAGISCMGLLRAGRAFGVGVYGVAADFQARVVLFGEFRARRGVWASGITKCEEGGPGKEGGREEVWVLWRY